MVVAGCVVVIVAGLLTAGVRRWEMFRLEEFLKEEYQYVGLWYFYLHCAMLL